jgi:hypothetical protein
MLGTKPSSAKCAGQLMCLSGGLAIAAGLFAWATTPATVYWLAVELTVGVLWLGASTAIRAGRLLVIITATVLCVVSIFVTGAMLVLLSLFAQTGPGAIVMLGDVIRLPLTVLIIVPVDTRVQTVLPVRARGRTCRASAAMDAGTAA